MARTAAGFAAIVLLVGGIAAAKHRADAQPSQGLSQAEQTRALATVGNYIGMAEFCTAHGVDYRPLASLLRDAFRQNARYQAGPDRSAFDTAVHFGARGSFYSRQSGDYTAVNGADARRACQFSHQQLMQVSQTVRAAIAKAEGR